MSNSEPELKAKARNLLITIENGIFQISIDIKRVIIFCTFLSSTLAVFAAILSLRNANSSDGVLAIIGIIWILAALVAAYGAHSFRFLKNEIDIKTIRQIRQFLSDGEAKKDRLLAQLTAVEASVLTLRGMMEDSQSVGLENDLDKLLHPLVVLRTQALGFEGDAIYNLVIYLYNPDRDIMELKWRECDETRLKRLNREWRPGQGHPGITHFQPEPWIVPSATHANFPGLFQGEHKQRDEQLYASFLSIPIGNYNNNRAIATLTITSSIPYQFNKDDYTPICNIYRSILSTYFYKHSPYKYRSNDSNPDNLT